MIYITGDTHGEIDFNKLLVLKDEKLSYDDYLIICGDAGICWSPNLFQKYLDLYNQLVNHNNGHHYYTFYSCGRNTQTGSAELAQIPSNWQH